MSETIQGVITAPIQHRKIEDIFDELRNHPDYVYGSYWTKSDIIDHIICKIRNKYEDDDGIDPQIIIDAEEIYNNNPRRLYKNLDYAYDYMCEDLDLLIGCDLSLEKQNK